MSLLPKIKRLCLVFEKNILIPIEKKVENIIIMLMKTIKKIYKICVKKFRSLNKKSSIKHIIKNIIATVFILGFIGTSIMLIWFANIDIPDLKNFNDRVVSQSTKIYDRTGTILLYDLNQNVKRTEVPLENISKNIQKASIAIEDADFYSHNGIRFSSIIRSVFANFLSGSFSQGGSTITQQVVKNSLLTKEKTITRKVKEAVLALKLEKTLTKDQILARYLNESPYGGTIYGVEEATQSFFGKPSKDVTLAESAYIAALPQAPSYFSPYGSHRDELDLRKNLVLKRMLDNKFITKLEYDSAKEEQVTFRAAVSTGIKAPHFVMFIKQYLETKYGEKMLQEGGIKVTTTLNYDIQKKAEEGVKEFALQNAKKFNASNAATVAIDPKTGQILMMVGSRDYFDKVIEGNYNVAINKRQPGSSFKPIVYATAFAKGFTPQTVLFDLKTQFSTSCDPANTTSSGGCYSPNNYDSRFRGPMSMKNALAQSINIPAVKALYLAGPDNVLETAKNMGITGLKQYSQYGFSMALGSAEVSLLDLTGAYSVFADEGIKNPTTGILKIEDREGNIIEEFKEQPTQVLSAGVADTISDILSDNDARAPSFGANSKLKVTGRTVAVKTGTTNDYKDAWTIGYTPQIVIGTWAGNNNNKPMDKSVAGLIIAPLWNSLITDVLKNIPDEPFPAPPAVATSTRSILRGFWQGGTTYTIDKTTGLLAGAYTPDSSKEERVLPDVHSILYWINKNDPTGPAPSNPSNDAQFRMWEYPVKIWAQSQGYGNIINPTISTTTDTVHNPDLAPKISLSLDPSDFTKDQRVTINLSVQTQFQVSRADYYINNAFIGSSANPPYTFNFVPKDAAVVDGQNTLKVIVYDSVLNKSSAEKVFTVTK